MIYLHIPFCQRRCIYCDFYSTTQSADVRRQFVGAMCRELALRTGYLPDRRVQTLYWGGGTPSQLSDDEMAMLMQAVRSHYQLEPDAEITFEANPDDLTPQRVETLRRLGFNRVSLGVQTFDDRLLKMLNRRHDAAQARRAVECLKEGGIDNISIDLIYGLPQQTPESFAYDLQQAFSLPIRHLSSYALSVEPGTELSRRVERGELTPAGEETCVAEYEALMAAAREAGMDHYEISNFGLPGYHSRHNSGYWDGTPYLGCGPGAHSFDGTDRRYNLPNLNAYIQAEQLPPGETEHLCASERFNELVFTSLRTRRGLDLERVRTRFGEPWLADLLVAARRHMLAGHLEQADNRLRLTSAALMVSDDIMSDLMRV